MRAPAAQGTVARTRKRQSRRKRSSGRRIWQTHESRAFYGLPHFTPSPTAGTRPTLPPSRHSIPAASAAIGQGKPSLHNRDDSIFLGTLSLSHRGRVPRPILGPCAGERESRRWSSADGRTRHPTSGERRNSRAAPEELRAMIQGAVPRAGAYRYRDSESATASAAAAATATASCDGTATCVRTRAIPTLVGGTVCHCQRCCLWSGVRLGHDTSGRMDPDSDGRECGVWGTIRGGVGTVWATRYSMAAVNHGVCFSFLYGLVRHVILG